MLLLLLLLLSLLLRLVPRLLLLLLLLSLLLLLLLVLLRRPLLLPLPLPLTLPLQLLLVKGEKLSVLHVAAPLWMSIASKVRVLSEQGHGLMALKLSHSVLPPDTSVHGVLFFASRGSEQALSICMHG